MVRAREGWRGVSVGLERGQCRVGEGQVGQGGFSYGKGQRGLGQGLVQGWRGASVGLERGQCRAINWTMVIVGQE